MPDDLRSNLLRHQLTSNHAPSRWSAFAQSRDAPLPEPPPRRVPVQIQPDGPLSSPEQLKDLAGLKSVPEVITVARARDLFEKKEMSIDDPTAELIAVCILDSDAEDRLTAAAHCLTCDIDEAVWFGGQQRNTIIVQSAKKEEQESAAVEEKS